MSIYYLLPNEHLNTLKSIMKKTPDVDLWRWMEGDGNEDTVVAILNKVLPVRTKQDLQVETLIIPEGMFVVGVGAGWMVGDKVDSRNSDLFPDHASFHDGLTTLLTLRRDFARLITPKTPDPIKLKGTGFTLDNANGYYAFRINGLYE